LPIVLVAFILPLLLLVGCSKSEPPKPVDISAGLVSKSADPGEWVLESYDANRGYIFSKDGIQYLAHCQFWNMLYADGNPVTFQRARSESDCASVLEYLHKPVPIEPSLIENQKDRIVFMGQTPKSPYCQFQIVSAK